MDVEWRMVEFDVDAENASRRRKSFSLSRSIFWQRRGEEGRDLSAPPPARQSDRGLSTESIYLFIPGLEVIS